MNNSLSNEKHLRMMDFVCAYVLTDWQTDRQYLHKYRLLRADEEFDLEDLKPSFPISLKSHCGFAIYSRHGDRIRVKQKEVCFDLLPNCQ